MKAGLQAAGPSRGQKGGLIVLRWSACVKDKTREGFWGRFSQRGTMEKNGDETATKRCEGEAGCQREEWLEDERRGEKRE